MSLVVASILSLIIIQCIVICHLSSWKIVYYFQDVLSSHLIEIVEGKSNTLLFTLIILPTNI